MGELYFYLVQECRSPPGALVLCDAYLFACIYIYVATLLEQPRDTRISLLRTAAASICCWVVQEVG